MAKATWAGIVLAESDNYEVVEGNIYFSPDSVNWQHLSHGNKQYTCPWKGETAYWNINIDGQVNPNSAWSYPKPTLAAMNIKGHVAFDRSSVEVES